MSTHRAISSELDRRAEPVWRTESLRGLAALGLSALLLGGSSSAFAQTGQGPTPGSQKLPDLILDLRRVATGHDGSLFSQRFHYGIGARGLVRKRCERGTDSDPWSCLESSESTSFYITALDCRLGGDELYIAGTNDDGSCVIERWSYPRRKNGWAVDVSTPPGAGIGTPLPPFEAALVVSNGDAWQPASPSSQSLKPAERSVIHTSQHGPIYGMAVDPQGRYLLFYDMGLKTLLRLDLGQTPPIATAIATTGTFPHLDQVGIVDLMDFEGEGRKCVIRREYRLNYRESQEVYTLLSDADNDGVFEDSSVMDAAAWEASPYSDWSRWDFFWSE